jgi:hypothetical protein
MVRFYFEATGREKNIICIIFSQGITLLYDIHQGDSFKTNAPVF